MKSLFFEMQFW